MTQEWKCDQCKGDIMDRRRFIDVSVVPTHCTEPNADRYGLALWSVEFCGWKCLALYAIEEIVSESREV